MSPADKLRDPASFCSTVLAILVDRFGVEVVNWDPATLVMEVEATFDIRVDDLLSDKMNAACALLASDLYHRSLETFTTINAVFNLRTVSSKSFNVVDLDEVAWGVTEAALLEGPGEFRKAGFSHPIARYVGELLSMEGVLKAPPELWFAEFDSTELDQASLALASDPVLAESVGRRAADTIADIHVGVAANLRALVEDLKEVDLEHGKPELPPELLKALGSVPSGDQVKAVV